MQTLVVLHSSFVLTPNNNLAQSYLGVGAMYNLQDQDFANHVKFG